MFSRENFAVADESRQGWEPLEEVDGLLLRKSRLNQGLQVVAGLCQRMEVWCDRRGHKTWRPSGLTGGTDVEDNDSSSQTRRLLESFTLPDVDWAVDMVRPDDDTVLGHPL